MQHLYADPGASSFITPFGIGLAGLHLIQRRSSGRAPTGAPMPFPNSPPKGMMQVLADEYQSRHLRVNCINPGGTRTGMRASAFPTGRSAETRKPR